MSARKRSCIAEMRDDRAETRSARVKYLIANGCGFVASNVAVALFQEHEDVVLFDWLSREETAANLHSLQTLGHAEFRAMATLAEHGHRGRDWRQDDKAFFVAKCSKATRLLGFIPIVSKRRRRTRTVEGVSVSR